MSMKTIVVYPIAHWLVIAFTRHLVTGSVLLKAAFVLILLSINLVEIIDHVTYDFPQFIALLVIGACLLCGFFLWESYGAQDRLLDCASLRDRTIAGVFMFNFIHHFCFHLYCLLIEMLGIVIYDLTTSTALDVANVAPAVAILSNALLGVVVYFTRQFKALCLYCLPLTILGFGLMIHVGQKGRNSSIADTIVCEVFVGLAFGALETTQTLALTVSSKRQDIPIVLSACSIVANVVGSKVSDAIKRSMFLPILRDALPENIKSIAESLYDGGDKV